MILLLWAVSDLIPEGVVQDPEVHAFAVWEVLAAHAVWLAVLVVPAAALAAVYGRLARRTGRAWLWGLVAWLLVALGAGVPQITLTFGEAAGMGMAIVGVGWPPVRQMITQPCQFLLTFAVGFLALNRSSRRFAAVNSVRH